jgi:hypothetical protein
MVGIDIDHISLGRRLPIDADHLARVVARLRLDAGATTLHWSLGDHGGCDIEVTFAPYAHPRGIAFTTTAVLWTTTGAARMDVQLEPTDDGEAQITMSPATPDGTLGFVRGSALRSVDGVAHAALEELAQELLWQHSRL